MGGIFYCLIILTSTMTNDKDTILIVEDDKFLAGIYRRKFEMENFKVQVASDGEAALQAVKKVFPQLIMLDILLPKVDGLTVLANLKADEATKNIPVILITNLGQRDDVEKGLALGALGYLIKAHFRPSELVEKVRQALNVN